MDRPHEFTSTEAVRYFLENRESTECTDMLEFFQNEIRRLRRQTHDEARKDKLFTLMNYFFSLIEELPTDWTREWALVIPNLIG